MPYCPFVDVETVSAPNYYKVLEQQTLSSISTNYFNKTSYKMSNKIMFFKFTTSHYWFNRAIYQPARRKKKKKLFHITYTLFPLFLSTKIRSVHINIDVEYCPMCCVYVCGLKKMNKKDDILLYDFFFRHRYPYTRTQTESFYLEKANC